MNPGGIILVVSFIVLMVLGAPIYLSVAGGAVIAALASGVKMTMIVQRLYAANDSFPLLAILFFCVSGELMLQGGIATRIVNTCKALASHVFGRLSVITFAACAFFGAISGSSLATTASIGKLMYPEMVKEGYRPSYAATLQAVGGTLGALIPPSITCVLYGVITGVSVGDMLLYILPVGVGTMIVYMLTSTWLMKRKKNPAYVPTEYAKEQESLNSIKNLPGVLKESIWALLTPVIILGGIYTGIFTPTECAIVATLYAWLIGMFVYKELDLRTTVNCIISSGVTSGCIMLIMDSASPLSWEMAYFQVATALANFVGSVVANKFILLLLINIVYFILGMFCDGNITVTIVVPLLYPIAMMYGVNGLHLGLITVLNVMIGTLSPPFGVAMFTASSITDVPVAEIMKEIIPFVVAVFCFSLLLSFVPLIWL